MIVGGRDAAGDACLPFLDRALTFEMTDLRGHGVDIRKAAAVLVALCMAVALGVAPAWGHEDGAGDAGPFGSLRPPELGAGEFRQDPPLPDFCSFRAGGAAFNALGRSPGPAASAHHAGGREVISPDGLAPFPQVFPIGSYTFEPNIALTGSGAILVDAVQCASNAGGFQPTVLGSTDGAASFHDISPSLGAQHTHQITEDPFLYLDKRTNRVFSTDIDNVGGCQPLSYSDDAGKTWTESQTGCGLADHANMFAGPAPAGATQPTGYSDVVYYCAIDGGALAEISKATSCEKSTDGGTSFVRTGEPAFVADPQITASNPTQCDGGTGPGFVDAKGTVYLPRGWCGQPYLAISHDEGQSWTRVQVSDLGMGTENDDATANLTAYNHEAGVRVDRAGNIYYVWVAHDRKPYLTISRDGAKTWSRPAMFGTPGVRQAWNPALDLTPSGRIAMGYMASINAPNGPFSDGPEDARPYKDSTWNGYIAISDDPLAADPTFSTASVNAPSRPFIKSAADPPSTATIPCGQVRCGQEFDFIDLKMTADGTPWAIFIDACGNGQKDCISPSLGAGVVARLVTPGSAAALDAAGPGLFGATSETTPAPVPATARRCASRRRFTIRLHRPRFVRLVSAVIYLNGQRIAARRGKRLTARVDLRNLPRGRFTVTIKARTTAGKTIIGRRHYRTCVPKRHGAKHHKV